MTDTGSGLRHAPSMSTEVLKALANPLRRQVWNEVTRARYARAADLAQRLDQPANTLSFHLRVLAQAGLIEEAPEKARDKRDRVWKPTSGAMSLGSPEDPVAIKCGDVHITSGNIGRLGDKVSVKINRNLRRPRMTLAAFERAVQKEMQNT